MSGCRDLQAIDRLERDIERRIDTDRDVGAIEVVVDG
jgi:hypothetical protein